MAYKNKGFYRILIVDDNEAIHDDFKKVLSTNSSYNIDLSEISMFLDEKFPLNQDSIDYQLEFANQGEEALSQVQLALDENNPFALAFIDIRMPPGLDGIETIQHLWKIDPYIQIVICTAYSDYSWSEISKKLNYSDQYLILKKPFESIEIRQLANALTKKWYLSQINKNYLQEVENQVLQKTEQLQLSYSLLRATFESTNDGILVVGKEQQWLDYNQKFLDLWRIPKEIAESQNEEKLIYFVLDQLKHPQEFLEKVNSLYIYSNAESHDILTFKDGRIFERYSKPQYLNEEIIGRVWSFRDITERLELEEKLAYQATHDNLTELPNRQLFFDRLQMAVNYGKRFNTLFGIIFIDLDHFKIVNDSLGHNVGDQLLKSAAARLQSCIRQTDTICRYGGDEFIVLIEHLQLETQIIDIVQKILVSFSKPFCIEGKNLNVTTSMGISFYPKDGKLPEILFKNADIAMYRAKEMCRNNFQFYNIGMNFKAEQRLELEQELRLALERKEFIIYYQPLIDLHNRCMNGVEALIRWQHPKKGLLQPSYFISIAEESGLIIPLGAWILEEVCKQNKKWQEEGLGKIITSVNVSPLQIKRCDLSEIVKKILTETELDPACLALEITENLMLEENEQIRASIENLKNLGVSIVIDDFGIGYSNLNLIRSFPIDKIKIDRSFIRNIVADSNDRAIVLAIIALAKSFKMTVLAEGVEDEAQKLFLEENQCDEMQGFFISEPLPQKKFENFLLNFKK